MTYMLNFRNISLPHILLFAFTGSVSLVVMFFCFHNIVATTRSFSPFVFPFLTVILLIFHLLIACFMVMKYLCDRQRVYHMPIAFAFATSALMMIGTLNSFPAWLSTPVPAGNNYNDAIIFFTLRNVMMVSLFISATLLFTQRKKKASTAHHLLVIGLTLFFSLVMLALAWLYSSASPLLSVVIINNNTRIFEPLWTNSIVWGLISLWLLSLFFLISMTRLRNIFWCSGVFFCICYISTLFILLADDHIESSAWYIARLFETTATLFIIIVLMADVFQLYRKSRSQYQISWENSIRDPMTRLYNRSYFYDSLSQRLPEAFEQTPISVIVSDLDRFKRINDTYGHLQGDKVIKFVARVLQEAVREQDIAARLGGEEFVLLLHNTSQADALCVAERIRRTIGEQDPAQSQGQLPETVTISMGIFTSDRYSLSAEECVERADKALYQAKEAGRNRVVLFQE